MFLVDLLNVLSQLFFSLRNLLYILNLICHISKINQIFVKAKSSFQPGLKSIKYIKVKKKPSPLMSLTGVFVFFLKVNKNTQILKIMKGCHSLSKNNYSVRQKILPSDLNCLESSSLQYFKFIFHFKNQSSCLTKLVFLISISPELS